MSLIAPEPPHDWPVGPAVPPPVPPSKAEAAPEHGLIGWCLDHARTVIAALVLILLAGWSAYQQIPKEAEPDIDVPYVYVSMTYEGISPEDSERLLLRPMETELRTIEGVKEMRSTAYLGGGNVFLEFDAGFNADKAVQDVREGVNRGKAELPQGTDEPRVTEINFAEFPVLVVTLTGSLPERELVRLARALQEDVEAIPSVLDANISGDREELLEVVVDPVKVESYGLRPDDILSLFQRSNRLVAAGRLDTGAGAFDIKVPGLFETPEDVWNMPVKVSGDAVVRVRDVASVRVTYKDPVSFARLDGQPAVALEVSKRAGQNIIDTIAAVKEVVEQEAKLWPGGVTYSFSQDRSEDVQQMLQDLGNNLAMTVLIVGILLIATLGWQSSLLVSIAVPGSFLAAILVLAAAGLTVNMMVLFGLILAAGNVVDGAIVVCEYADRKMSDGIPRRAAYALAARRMAWPIIASVATQLSVFLPLLFWPGIVGQFMSYFPITQFVTLSASLAMALIFVPTLGALVGRKVAAGSIVDDRPVNYDSFYGRFLRGALRRSGLVLAGAFATLILVLIAFGMFNRGVEFFADVEPSLAEVRVHARGNLSIYEKDQLVRDVEARILGIDGIKSVYTSVSGGQGGGGFGSNPAAPDVIGTVALSLKDWRERPKAAAILGEIERRTADLAGIRVETVQQEAGPPQGKPINLEVSAIDPAMTSQAVDYVRHMLEATEVPNPFNPAETIRAFRNIEDTRPLPGIEWVVAVNRSQAAKFGLDVSAIGESIRFVTNGAIVATYRPDGTDDEVDIVLRYPEQLRNLDQLDNIRVQTAEGAVPISNFITRRPQQRVGILERVDQKRFLAIRADVAPGLNANQMIQQVKATLAKPDLLPTGVEVKFRGQDESQAESSAFLSQAFVFGLFLMGVILLTQFNSFYSAFLILSSVILSTTGVFLGMLLTGQTFSIVLSGLGVIALAGIVVQNNIVLIDTYDQLKKEMADPVQAILRTGIERARPVLLTAFNTVLGLLPIAFGISVDILQRDVSIGAPATQFWIQLSSAIAFGLTFATVLTLVVTPCALMLRVRFKRWRGRAQARRALRRQAKAGHPPGLPALPEGAE